MLAAFAVVALFALVACGGDDEEETNDAGGAATRAAETTSTGSGSTATTTAPRVTSTTTPASGGTITVGPEAAMLRPEDLPGTGWTVTSTAQTDDFGLGTGDAAACKQINDTVAAYAREEQAARSGRAAVALTRQSQLIPATVSSTVATYRNNDAPRKGVDTFRNVMSGDAFTNCMTETLKSSLAGAGGNPQLTVKNASASATAPEGGFGRAFDIEMSVSGISLTFRIEAYGWQYRNAMATVVFLGTPTDGVPDVPRAAVTKTQERLRGGS